MDGAQFEAFFGAVLDQFHAACSRSPHPVDHFYRIGGRMLHFRFANAALIPFITPALEHLRCDPVGSPDLTVCLWDSRSTETVLPPLSQAVAREITRSGVFRYHEGPRYAVVNGVVGMLNLLNIRQRMALFCLRQASGYPSFQVSSPLPVLLHWGLQPYGLQFVHAAAVGTPSLGGVLIVGRGGSGKSTTALACLASDLHYIADDYCLVSSGPVPSVYNLYGSAKVGEEAFRRFASLAPLGRRTDYCSDGKGVIFVDRHYPGKILDQCPLRAILVPVVTGRPETTLSAASAALGLKALAPSTIFQLSCAGEEAFQTMAWLVKEVPCYRLELGTDLSRIPGVILDLLSKERSNENPLLG